MKIPAPPPGKTHHYGLRIAIALSLSASLGCSKGEVTFTGVDDFGRVQSALWTPEQTISTYQFGDDGTLEAGSRFQYQRVSLNHGRYTCRDRVRYLEAVDEALQALLAATDDGQDADAVCAEMETFLDGLIDASNINESAAQHLHFDFPNGDTLEEQTYGLQEWWESGGAYEAAFGFVQYPEEDTPTGETFRAYKEAWNPERCEFDAATLEAYPFSEPESWHFTEGIIEVSYVEIGKASAATFEGTLEDADGNSGGSAVGSFDADFCNDRLGYTTFVFPRDVLMPPWP